MPQEFVIRPNNSLGRFEFLLLGGTFTGLLVLMAVRLALMGFWLILPFLLVDFAAVAIAFYLIRRKCCLYESVRIDDRQLEISHHERRNTRSWSFDIHWARLELQPGQYSSQASRLLVGSHGKWIEFAGFLTNEERESLFQALNRALRKQLQNV